MAAISLPEPGSEYGPCDRDADCQHIDCVATRDAAAEACQICGKPIGYNTRYYSGPKHARCLEDQIERAQEGN